MDPDERVRREAAEAQARRLDSRLEACSDDRLATARSARSRRAKNKFDAWGVMNTLTFHHQDGDMTFQVRWAWFLVTPSNHLTLSIECKEKAKYDWMANPSFCLVDFPLPGPLAAETSVRFPGNGPEDATGPRAYVYVGIHQEPRDVEFRFRRVTKNTCDVEFSWAQPDTDYYDQRAKENRVVGQCKLKRGEMKNMWIPY